MIIMHDAANSDQPQAVDRRIQLSIWMSGENKAVNLAFGIRLDNNILYIIRDATNYRPCPLPFYVW